MGLLVLRSLARASRRHMTRNTRKMMFGTRMIKSQILTLKSQSRHSPTFTGNDTFQPREMYNHYEIDSNHGFTRALLKNHRFTRCLANRLFQTKADHTNSAITMMPQQTRQYNIILCSLKVGCKYIMQCI